MLTIQQLQDNYNLISLWMASSSLTIILLSDIPMTKASAEYLNILFIGSATSCIFFEPFCDLLLPQCYFFNDINKGTTDINVLGFNSKLVESV